MTSRTRKWEPRPDEIKVRPVTLAYLHKVAAACRVGIGARAPIDIERVLNLLEEENLLTYEVLDDSELTNAYGLTQGRHIRLRESVLEAICDQSHQSHTRHRFTTAHEIGHALLHNYVTEEGFARREPPPKIYYSSEWQANTFAGFLLVPLEIAREELFDVHAISQRCNVSPQVAGISAKKYRKLE